MAKKVKTGSVNIPAEDFEGEKAKNSRNGLIPLAKFSGIDLDWAA